MVRGPFISLLHYVQYVRITKELNDSHAFTLATNSEKCQ